MEFPYNIYWILGLLSIVFVNWGACPVCFLLPITIAFVLNFSGYKPQAGFILIGGLAIPLAVRIMWPQLDSPRRMLLGCGIALFAYVLVRWNASRH